MNERAAALIVPYAVWMALMLTLPPGALGYAVRTFATAAALAWALPQLAWRQGLRNLMRPSVLGLGVSAGLAVFALWVLPEDCEAYRRFAVAGTSAVTGRSYDPAVCGWELTAVRAVGSAFVIAMAEELFFRRWLVRFAGFWATVALFAVEHDRWLVGAAAGVVYGLLAWRQGLAAAVAAHVTTNLAMAVHVLSGGHWEFW